MTTKIPATLAALTRNLTDITARQWTPEMVRHFNRHDAFGFRTEIEGKRVDIDTNGEGGPIFAVTVDGKHYRAL